MHSVQTPGASLFDGLYHGAEICEGFFSAMEQACQRALAQIRDRRYQEYLLNDGRSDIILYGITFCRKRCRVVEESA